jgi:hypothetical protein
MKLVIILALIASSFLPILPASADGWCITSGSDNPNHQSSLSSTTEGGNTTCSEQPA